MFRNTKSKAKPQRKPALNPEDQGLMCWVCIEPMTGEGIQLNCKLHFCCKRHEGQGPRCKNCVCDNCEEELKSLSEVVIMNCPCVYCMKCAKKLHTEGGLCRYCVRGKDNQKQRYIPSPVEVGVGNIGIFRRWFLPPQKDGFAPLTQEKIIRRHLTPENLLPRPGYNWVSFYRSPHKTWGLLKEHGFTLDHLVEFGFGVTTLVLFMLSHGIYDDEVMPWLLSRDCPITIQLTLSNLFEGFVLFEEEEEKEVNQSHQSSIEFAQAMQTIGFFEGGGKTWFESQGTHLLAFDNKTNWEQKAKIWL